MLDVKKWYANIENRALRLFESTVDEYLDDEFISNNTDFEDLMELCEALKTIIILNRGIQTSEASKEQFFNKRTKFGSWEDMLSAATDYHES